MRQLLILLLVLAGAAEAAVNATPDQAVYETTFGGSTTLTIDTSGEGWVQPTSGDIIVLVATGKGGSGSVTSWPSGFTQVCANSGSDFWRYSAYKIATGSGESSLAVTASITGTNWAFSAFELDATDLDTASGPTTICDTTNLNANTTSVPSGTASAPSSDGLAFAAFSLRRVNTFDGRSYTNSFVESLPTGLTSSTAGALAATKVVTASGNQTTTLSTTDTGDEAVGELWIWDISTPPAVGSFSDTSPVPGGNTTYTCGTNLSSTITTLTSPDGDVINANGGATNCIATFTIPSVDEFTSTGSMNNTEWNVTGTWTITGTITETADMEIDTPFTGLTFWDAGVACTSCPTDSLAPPGIALADDHFSEFLVGSGDISDYLVPFLDGDTATIRTRTYDDSASQWTDPVTHEFIPPEEPDPVPGSPFCVGVYRTVSDAPTRGPTRSTNCTRRQL